MPPTWYDQSAGGTRLWGQFARTYLDPDDQDPAAGSEQGGTRVQIPASNGVSDWLYTRTTFPLATCPTGGCSWNSANIATASTNAFQVATNVHVQTSRFLEYLAQAPIGFDEASGSFRGVDYVQAEVNDGEGFNNANFGTPRNGIPPRMQMFLFTGRNANGGDVADIIFHEIGHGLSNRLIVNASGSGALNGLQPSMMGEGWSDFYALDFLVHQGLIADTPATGELKLGTHAVGTNGVRNKPMDCPVAPAGAAECNRNGTAATVLGGYTYGDLPAMNNAGGPHNGGELWAQTLWDLRRAVGHDAAMALVTGGMRLTRDDPTMIDARDGIILQALAMRSAAGAADDYFDEVWETFRARGMGFDATTTGPADAAPVENFNEPWNALYVREPIVSDPYPSGDNDGHMEAGETLHISAPVYSAGLTDLPGVTGTLTSPSATIVDGGAAWPLLGRGRTAANADALAARMPAACGAPVPLTVSVTSPDGTFANSTEVSLIPTSRTVVPLADRQAGGPVMGTEATFTVAGGGTVTDVDVHIRDLRHTFLGDIEIELVHAGERVTLFNPPDGLNADHIIDAVFDSDSATPVFSAGAGPATGRMRPQEAAGLDDFDGLPAAGDWTLRITDAEPGDAGTLREWGPYGPGFPCGRLEIPAASTGGADGTTVRGTVTPNGRATGLRFAYGTTTAYGATTATQDVGSGDAPVPASAELTGLAPGTTYHYRVEAIREGDVVAVAGEDMTFRTAAAPVPVPTASATPAPGGGADRTAPAFAGRPKVKLAKAGRKNRRATFSFSLSEAARVNAVVTRAEKGIRKGKRCVAVPKRKPKGAKNCTRQVNAARGSTAPGATTLALPKKGLGKGRYTAVLTAVDAAGNQSRATVTFTIR
jgi:subtilisin-like proprotein convertase family protein